jgi:hypothetical protein
MSAQASLKNQIKFITCGSIAESSIVVTPGLKTLATIKFSVEVTQNQALIVISPEFGFPVISTHFSVVT